MLFFKWKTNISQWYFIILLHTWSHLRLVEEDLFIEIEELELIDDSSEPFYQKLLKPVINSFKLIILNVKEGVLQMVDFPKDKIKEFGFDLLINNN